MARVCEMWTTISFIGFALLGTVCRRGGEVDGVDGAGELAGEEFSLSLSFQEKMVLTEGMRRFGARAKRWRGYKAMIESCKPRMSDSETASPQSSTSRNSRSIRQISRFPKRPVAIAQ